jgi:hypothetical protein
MTVDVHAEGEHRFRVLELSNAGWPPEEIPPCGDPAGAFLDIALTSDVFRAVAFIAERPHESGPLRTVTDLTEAIRKRPVLERAMQAGFEVVFGIRMTIPALQAQFVAWGYRELGRGRFGAEDEHDPSTVPWNATKEDFASAVEQAALHATTLCIFGHDADPVYLLSTELAEQPQSQP